MKTVIKIGAVFGAMVMLAACANTYEVNKVSKMAVQGDAFATDLHKRYIERAQFEMGEGNWSSVAFFNTRAEMAAMGNSPAAQMPSERNLKVDADAINMAYDTLSTALNSTAPKVAPDACALSQTWFEHWMEQAEEGHQPDHIAKARGEFQKAMPMCKEDMPMSKAVADLPPPLIVYFDHNSAEITSSTDMLIGFAAKAALNANAKRAIVTGHTDTSGSSAYNAALSERRATAVAKALELKGVPAAEIRASHAGETSLDVKTDDGVQERKNRRVEVMFER